MRNLSTYITEARNTVVTAFEVIKFLQGIKNKPEESDWLFCAGANLVELCSYLNGYTGCSLDEIHEGFEEDPETLEEIFEGAVKKGAQGLLLTRTKTFEKICNTSPLTYWRDEEGYRLAIYPINIALVRTGNNF